MTAQLVMDALLMAILRRGRPEAVLHHSDQDSQQDFQRLLEAQHHLQHEPPRQLLG
jgi:putative transposase